MGFVFLKFVLLVFIFAAMNYFLARKLKPHMDIKSNTSGNSIPVLEKSEEEKFFEKISSFRDAIQKNNSVEINGLRQELFQIEETLEAMKKFSDKIGVTEAIALLAKKLEELHIQDSWEHNHPKGYGGEKVDGVQGLYYISGSDVLNGSSSKKIIDEFRFKESLYILILVINSSTMPDGSDHESVEMTLKYFDGNEYNSVFVCDAVREENYRMCYPDLILPCKIGRVTQIKLGDWISDLIEIHELLKISEERSDIEWKIKMRKSKPYSP